MHHIPYETETRVHLQNEINDNTLLRRVRISLFADDVFASPYQISNGFNACTRGPRSIFYHRKRPSLLMIDNR